MVKIGDKVRFLNSVGGGVVRRFVSKDVVSVEEDDGFEMPVLARECVVIEQASEIKLAQEQAMAKIQPVVPIAPTNEPKRFVKETADGERMTLALAYMPIDIKALQSTSYECYLVNDSNYHVAFTYLNQQGNQWNLRAAGTVEPHQHHFLEEFSKEDLNDLERVAVQYLPFKSGKPFALKQPGLLEYRMDVTRFYKLHAFRENDYFEDEAIIVPVVLKDKLQSNDPVATLDPMQLAAAMREKERADRPERRRVVHKPTDANKPMEVDLHIHELVDSIVGMDNAAMLELQLGKVGEVMDENKRWKGKRIVFIHGKGEGVLRNAVLKLLKDKYPQCQTQDASFKEYGYGATLVIVR